MVVNLLDHRLMPMKPLRQLRCAIGGAWNALKDPSRMARSMDLEDDLRATEAALRPFIAGGADQEDGRGTFAILAMTNQPMKAKFYALLAKAVQLAGYSPLILHQPGQAIARRYFDLFGLEVLDWDHYATSGTSGESESIQDDPLTLAAVKAREYKGVPVGLYALSATCRSLKRFPTDLDTPEFARPWRRNLQAAVAAVDASERILKVYPIRKLLLRDLGYVPAGPLMDVALRKGVDCLVVADSQRSGTWVFKRYTTENRRDHEFSISRPLWEGLREEPLTEERDRAVDEELSGRYTDDAAYDKRRLQSGKIAVPPAELRESLGLDPARKTAAIFAHVSWDGAFFFGEDLFESFDEWLLETTRAACANPRLNWVVKLHPLNTLIHAFDGAGNFEESEMAYLRSLEPLPKHVKILHSDTPINTRSLLEVIDYAITVRGTIGLEAPCLGITALTAGTGRYEGRGFTIDSASREQYFERLDRLEHVPTMPTGARRLARLHYFHLMRRRQVSFDDIARMEVRQRNEADHRLFNNIHIRARSLDDIRRSPSLAAFVTWVNCRDQLDLVAPDSP